MSRANDEAWWTAADVGIDATRRGKTDDEEEADHEDVGGRGDGSVCRSPRSEMYREMNLDPVLFVRVGAGIGT